MTDVVTHIPHPVNLLSDLQKLVVADNARWLFTTTNELDWDYADEWANKPLVWEYPRVCFDTFIDSPEFLGSSTWSTNDDGVMECKVYPAIRQLGKDILEGKVKFQEAVVIAGIGGGKTTLSELLACYATHTLLCMRDPYKFFGLVRDKPISIINMGTSATQAVDNAFAGIKEFIAASPWFQKCAPNMLEGSIHFEDKNILLLSGNSKSTTPLGYNIYYAILDEAAFYMDTERKQVAEEIYTALQRRIVSRFKGFGLVIMISSPQYDGDFTIRKLEEARRFPDIIYSAQQPTWKLQPMKPEYEATKFYFNAKKNLVVETFDPAESVCKLNDVFDASKTIWEIPIHFKKSFLQDPDKAKRDFAAVPSKAIMAFMPHVEILKGMFDDRESPVLITGGYKFAERPIRTSYYIHVDLALNRGGKGDHAGFAMAHFADWVINSTTGETQKKVVVDLAERISMSPAIGEIDLSEVKNKIYGLKAQGFSIALVTFDQFQSAGLLQELHSKGIKAEYLSVDRTIEPYQTLKELIYAGNVKCHKSDILLDELLGLEITKANKVDHSPTGSKDVSDAVAGAVFHVVKESGGQIGLASGDLIKMAPIVFEDKVQQGMATEEEKRAYYTEIQKQLDTGLLDDEI